MLIDDYIERAENAIKENNLEFAKKIFNEIVNVYIIDIKGLLEGTSESTARSNVGFNVNIDDSTHKFPTETDYINDLQIILPKLKKYAEEVKIKKGGPMHNAPVSNQTISINNSEIKNSNIGTRNSEKRKLIKLLALFATILAGVAAVITLILEIIGYI
ncbi:MAG TPA: hypothetical protein GX708_12635 [Gallicola sp.]|nr:hypothetical protein [Gallicola sp.]